MAFPGTYNIRYYRGDTYGFILYPKNNDGSTFDLTGYTAAFTIAATRGGAAVVTATATVSVDKTHVNCVISPSQGGQLTPGTTYVYDVEVSKDASTVYTLVTGTVSVTGDVT